MKDGSVVHKDGVLRIDSMHRVRRCCSLDLNWSLQAAKPVAASHVSLPDAASQYSMIKLVLLPPGALHDVRACVRACVHFLSILRPDCV